LGTGLSFYHLVLRRIDSGDSALGVPGFSKKMEAQTRGGICTGSVVLGAGSHFDKRLFVLLCLWKSNPSWDPCIWPWHSTLAACLWRKIIQPFFAALWYNKKDYIFTRGRWGCRKRKKAKLPEKAWF